MGIYHWYLHTVSIYTVNTLLRANDSSWSTTHDIPLNPGVDRGDTRPQWDLAVGFKVAPWSLSLGSSPLSCYSKYTYDHWRYQVTRDRISAAPRYDRRTKGLPAFNSRLIQPIVYPRIRTHEHTPAVLRLHSIPAIQIHRETELVLQMLYWGLLCLYESNNLLDWLDKPLPRFVISLRSQRATQIGSTTLPLGDISYREFKSS